MLVRTRTGRRRIKDLQIENSGLLCPEKRTFIPPMRVGKRRKGTAPASSVIRFRRITNAVSALERGWERQMAPHIAFEING
jgi:hypothetical protein